MDLAAATRQRLVFYVRRLGQVAVVSLHGGREMPVMVKTSRKEVLRLCCSPDGWQLVVAYADGTAELFGLRYDDDGLLADQHLLRTFAYLLPKVAAPVMSLDNGLLHYQDRGLRPGSVSFLVERLDRSAPACAGP